MRRALSVVAGLALTVCAPSAAETYKAGETFDAVWKIVRDTHFDPSFDAAKWDLIGKELRPKAVEARTPGELRAVLGDMLGRLGLSHFAVIPGTAFGMTEGCYFRVAYGALQKETVAEGVGRLVAGMRAMLRH